MSSGFVTESEIAEAKRRRQEDWEKVRTPDQPLEAPEDVYDPRPLYQRLEEQKMKKDADYEETHKLKNMIRGLDDDEVGFLDLVEQSKAIAARKISLEEKREMADFREKVNSLKEEKEKERLALTLGVTAPKKPLASTNSNKNKLQGLIVRKRKTSETDAVKENNVSNKIGKIDDDIASNISELGATESTSPVLKCIGILPGLGCYNNDSSDSDQSSDTDEESNTCSRRLDLCGRPIKGRSKKKTKKPS